MLRSFYIPRLLCYDINIYAKKSFGGGTTLTVVAPHIPHIKCSKTAGQDMWQGIIGYKEGRRRTSLDALKLKASFEFIKSPILNNSKQHAKL